MYERQSWGYISLVKPPTLLPLTTLRCGSRQLPANYLTISIHATGFSGFFLWTFSLYKHISTVNTDGVTGPEMRRKHEKGLLRGAVFISMGRREGVTFRYDRILLWQNMATTEQTGNTSTYLLPLNINILQTDLEEWSARPAAHEQRLLANISCVGSPGKTVC